MGRDLRLALRSLRRAPLFTITVVLSLGASIALAAAGVAVLNAYLLRSMPYPAADRLYHVMYAPPATPAPGGTDKIDWASLAGIVEAVDYSFGAFLYVREGGHTEEVPGVLVSAGSLDTLGARPTIGRAFNEQDFLNDAAPVALASASYWRSHFGNDAPLLNRVVEASVSSPAGRIEHYRIVGVLPDDFRYAGQYAQPRAIAVPLRTRRSASLVRLSPGVPPAAAESRITEAVRRIATSIPPNWVGVRVQSVRERYAESVRPLVTAAATAAGVILLVGWANVAVLMLLRTARRRPELLVRTALGASPGQVFRMLVVEMGVVCGAAIATGLVAAALALRVLGPVIEVQLGRPAIGGTAALAVDPTVVGAIAAASVVLMLAVVGVAALAARRAGAGRAGPNAATRGGTDSPAMTRARFALTAAEIAGTLALLIGGGLMTRTVVNLMHADLGFRYERVVRTRIALSGESAASNQAMASFYERLLREAGTAESAIGLMNWPVFAQPQKHPMVRHEGDVPILEPVIAVSPGYFPALGIAVTQGRAFTDRDRLGAEPVVMVSETMARTLWPGEPAVGKRLRTAERSQFDAPLGEWRNVIGVVADVKQTFQDTDLNDVYVPFLQAPQAFAPVVIGTAQSPDYWLTRLRAAAAVIDPRTLVSPTTTLAIEVDRQLAGPRFVMGMLGGVACFAVLLAALGTYGVTAYAVQQRRREVAIRVALGATRRAVMRLFLDGAARMLAVGVPIGLGVAALLTTFVEGQLRGVGRFDPATFAVAIVILIVSVGLSTWWPSRRASREDPTTALKAD